MTQTQGDAARALSGNALRALSFAFLGLTAACSAEDGAGVEVLAQVNFGEPSNGASVELRSGGDTSMQGSVQARTRSQASSSDAVAFDFVLDGRALQLSLVRAEPPSGLSVPVLRMDAAGSLVESTVSVPDCFYEGVVVDVETQLPLSGSFASITTCVQTGGYGESLTAHGVFAVGGEVRTLSPLPNEQVGAASPGAGIVHLSYPAEALRLSPSTASPARLTLSPSRPLASPPSGIWEGSTRETKLVEILLVHDARRTMDLGEQVVPDGIALMENVNAMLAGSGISPRVRVVVTGQLVLEQDPFEWPAAGGGEVAASESLQQLTAWGQQAELPPRDALMMLSGQDLAQSTVGVANVGAMCGPSASLLIQTTSITATIGVNIVAHELGHSLGMRHDGVDNGCSVSGFIMASSTGGPGLPTQIQFSECSQQEFTGFLADGHGGTCLRDAPSMVAVDSCGDGAVGPGEQCDCGEADCGEIDPCCNGATCQLAPGAQCSTFNDPTACCVECRMATIDDAITCRPAQSDCDTAEVCTGTSFECPGDSFAIGGESCVDGLGENGTCFAGACVSRAQQCREIAAKFDQDFVQPTPSCAAQAGCGEPVCSLGAVCYLIEGEQTHNGIACGTGDICFEGACSSIEQTDECPRDPGKSSPGVCGCGQPDVDTDLDLTLDCQDECPEDQLKLQAGECGCGAPEVDGVGITECGDSCPDDPEKTAPGSCGCGTSDADRDGDGSADCVDGCPDNADKLAPDANGCEEVFVPSAGGTGTGSAAGGTPGSGSSPGTGGSSGGGPSAPGVGGEKPSGDSGGCAWSPPKQHGGAWGMFAPLFLVMWRRRRSARPQQAVKRP